MLEILFLVTIITSFAGTYLIKKNAVRSNLMDIPNIRSSHTQPTPRGGGLAIVFSWYLGLFGLKWLGYIEANLFYALISGALLALVSFLDDLYDLKPVIRIFFQIATVVLGIYFLGGFTTLYFNNSYINYPFIFSIIAIIGAVWFINLFNFLDGIDGYASVEAIAVTLGIFLVTQSPIYLLLILAIIGFLFWNWPKAKIFMGDIGSTQLGYILIILGIFLNNEMRLNFIGWLILTSLFWIDATFTLLRRWKNGEKLSQAHKKHYYQRIVQFGYSHQKVILISIILNLIFVFLVLFSEKGMISYFITFPLCLLINYILVKFIDLRMPFKTS